MCWADKIALVVAAIILGCLFFLGSVGERSAVYAQVYSPAWWEAFGAICWTLGYKIVLPLWLVLRAVDLVAGGPRRRRGDIIVRRVE